MAGTVPHIVDNMQLNFYGLITKLCSLKYNLNQLKNYLVLWYSLAGDTRMLCYSIFLLLSYRDDHYH